MARVPHMLMILDGWGHSSQEEHNAIAGASTPYWDHICKNNPHTLIEASGEAVGLPAEQMGNSEVGHMTIGAGRKIEQDLTRIEQAITDKSFFSNKVLLTICKKLKDSNCGVHLIGLLSDGGVHSHEEHWQATLSVLKKQGITKNVFLHPILDGRDVAPKSALIYLEKMDKFTKKKGLGKIVDICGRYYAMDRDKRYNRTKMAFELYCYARTERKYTSFVEAIEESYKVDVVDEFLLPSRVVEGDEGTIKAGDVVIFLNFRADRARQLCYALTDSSFNKFSRGSYPQISSLVTMTEYSKDIKSRVIFPTPNLPNVLGEYLANIGKTQLRIAETEKYAHVTFFLNGGVEQEFFNEDRVLVPSPRVATYDMQPEMSALAITNVILEQLDRDYYDVIVCNFANPDMLGHTGNYAAAVQSIEHLDTCLGKVLTKIDKLNGETIITADHGNAERMYNAAAEQPHTAHTTSLVPLVYIGGYEAALKEGGSLVDVAPTFLQMMELEVPSEMTGSSLLDFY